MNQEQKEKMNQEQKEKKMTDLGMGHIRADWSSYKGSSSIVKFNCQHHGEFHKTFSNLLQSKHGCPSCGEIARIKKYSESRLPLDKVKAQFESLALVNITPFWDTYVDTKKEMKFVCSKHGEFQRIFQYNESQKDKYLCPKCIEESRGIWKGMNFETFVEKAKEIHGDIYEYDKASFVGRKFPIRASCSKHGWFTQDGHDHLQGCGCQMCGYVSRAENEATSIAEQEIVDWLNSLGFEVENRYINKEGFEADIYLKKHSLAIEYHGTYWHSCEIGKPEEKRLVNAHRKKMESFEKENIQLVQIWEDDWKVNKESWKRLILSKVGASPGKLSARSCSIEILNFQTAKAFIDEYHIQKMGGCKPTLSLGLVFKNHLVSVVCLTKRGNYSELARYASSVMIVGGFRKLLKKALEHHPDIYSFADLEIVSERNNVYSRNGFIVVSKLPPDYKYVVGSKRIHKFNCRKEDLVERGADSTLSERKMATQLGYRICYDSGKLKYAIQKQIS